MSLDGGLGRPLEVLLSLADPPATINLDVLVVVAHGMHGEFVLAVLLGHQRGQGVAGAGGVCLVDEIDALLAVHVKRHLGGTECFVLANHVLHVAGLHAQLIAKVDIELDVGAENLNVAVLVVLVSLGGIEVY